MKIPARIWLVTDYGAIEFTADEHILRNLDWNNPRIRVEYCRKPA